MNNCFIPIESSENIDRKKAVAVAGFVVTKQSQQSEEEGSEQVTINNYDELVRIWGGYPASKPLTYGASSTCVNGNVNADNLF